MRRTDKIGTEAQFHSLDEYMRHVDLFYAEHHPHVVGTDRRVYIASDEVNVLDEAVASYPEYTFVFNKEGSQLAQSQSTRYTMNALRGTYKGHVVK